MEKVSIDFILSVESVFVDGTKPVGDLTKVVFVARARNMVDVINKFKAVLENWTDYGRVIRLIVTIDGISGRLTIEKYQESPTISTYVLSFCYNRLCCEVINAFGESVNTPDEVIDLLKKYKRIKITKHGAVEGEIMTVCHQAINELIGNVPQECYVCLGDTYGHKTTCNHNICLQCFIKSSQGKTVFTCGICRAVEMCGECECSD